MISKYLRVPFLMLACGGVVFVFAKLLLAPPTVKSYAPRPYTFPESVPLPNWTQQGSEPLDLPDSKSSVLAAHHYQYRQNEVTLQIKMRYLRGNGEVKGYLDNHTNIPTDPTIRKTEAGYYGVLTHDGTAYLSTCIAPRGRSSFTAKQFQRNALLYDPRPSRVLKWWLGQQRLIDQRCLWAHLSTPVENGSAEAAYDVLEAAWQPWLEEWQSRFPKL